MNVTVLYGGPSAERAVSLVSGRAVIAGLEAMGHTVFGSDVSPDDLYGLDHPADVIFPVLHGTFGESGELQEILESRSLPFVGSGSAASRLGMDKVATKRAWEAAGLPTPPYQVVTGADWSGDLPVDGCVVKAINSGSSLDVHVCKAGTADYGQRVVDALGAVLKSHGTALVEHFIPGPELTVGLLEEEPLAPIRIVPRGEFFDHHAKYAATDTEHRFDTGLPESVVEHCRDLSRRANAIVGGLDLARIDVMLDGENRPYLLEINTMPGFTPKSLLPEAAAHAGIPFGLLVDRLARRAAARGGR